jgi:hypothetical protein
LARNDDNKDYEIAIMVGSLYDEQWQWEIEDEKKLNKALE